MTADIIKMSLGIANAYLVKSDKGAILVDTGVVNSGKTVEHVLRKHGLELTDINLIVITHGHADHVGSVAELTRLCNAPVAIHKADSQWLIDGKSMPANPVTRGARFMMNALRMIESRFVVTPTIPDILIDTEDLDLMPYGIDGRAIPTPGHTEGSVSVVLDDGRAIVGDMAMQGIPVMRWRAGTASIAVDVELMKKTWKKLLEQGVKTVFPGHGHAFDADIIAKELAH